MTSERAAYNQFAAPTSFIAVIQLAGAQPCDGPPQFTLLDVVRFEDSHVGRSFDRLAQGILG